MLYTWLWLNLDYFPDYFPFDKEYKRKEKDVFSRITQYVNSHYFYTNTYFLSSICIYMLQYTKWKKKDINNELIINNFVRYSTDFTETMRILGYPRLISIANFRTPNFPLVAEILVWLVKRFDLDADITCEHNTEEERIFLIRSVAEFMVTN